MKANRHKLSFFLIVLALVGLCGCKQETPEGKAKAAAALGNEVTEVAGQAAVDAIKTPMDEARQAEGKLQKSAEQTAAELKKSMQ